MARVAQICFSVTVFAILFVLVNLIGWTEGNLLLLFIIAVVFCSPTPQAKQ